jgi:hypothetical protein
MRKPIAKNKIERSHVLDALLQIDREGVPTRREGRRHDLLFEGRTYPPKLVISYAEQIALRLREPKPADNFSGGVETNSVLEGLGFVIVTGYDTNASPKQRAAALETTLKSVSETERTASVRQRIGQAQFRKALLEHFGERCAVVGPLPAEMLRASHIKPWAHSNGDERLDPADGLLLSPAYDAAFDAGLITFCSDGKIKISPALETAHRNSLGLAADAVLERTVLTDARKAFLGWHQTSLFRHNATP